MIRRRSDTRNRPFEGHGNPGDTIGAGLPSSRREAPLCLPAEIRMDRVWSARRAMERGLYDRESVLITAVDRMLNDPALTG